MSSATHLGHELHETGTMDYDTRVKKAQFISNSLEIREVFNFASPAEILVAMKVYTCSFYGSNLWVLGGNMSEQVFNAWGTAGGFCLLQYWLRFMVIFFNFREKQILTVFFGQKWLS